MTHKDDDPGQWLAAQFAPKGDEAGTTDDSQPSRRASNDDSPTPDPAGAAPGESPRTTQFGKNSLPLRRPVLPTGGGYTWGLTPGGGVGPDGSVPPARPYPEPPPVAAVSTPASRPSFPEAKPASVANDANHANDANDANHANDANDANTAADTQADDATGRPPEPDNGHGLLPEPPASVTVAPPSAAPVSPAPVSPAPPPALMAPGFSAPTFSAPTFSAPTFSAQPLAHPAPSDPAPSVPAPSDTAPSDTAPSDPAPSDAIPTIQEVLDSPSPRRAAREAAAREAAAHAAAARSGGGTPPQLPPAPAETAVRPPAPVIVPAEPGVPVEPIDPAPPIPATGFAASGGPAPSSDVDVPSGTTTAEMRALFGELSEDTRALPASQNSREHPPAESAPSDAPSAYVFDPNAQFFVGQSSSSQVNAPRSTGDATDPASGPLAGDWPKQANYQQQSDQRPKGPRNQRVVLFVLLGLVVVLGVVLAVNLLL